MSKNITEFKGEYRWLSNFWPVDIELDGIIYPSVEHAYQAAKTMDLNYRKMILNAPTAGKAKRLGYKAPLRENWEQIKLSVMEDLIRKKFSQEIFAEKLLSTRGCKLIEGNDWGDSYWGVSKGKGENHLKKILMAIRSELEK